MQSFNRYAIHTHNLDITFGFTTSNPQDENFSHHLALDKRNWTKEKLLAQISCPQMHFPTFTPFVLLDKKFVIKQYYNNNWTELLETTRSCEQEYYEDQGNWRVKFPTLKNYIHGTTPMITCCDVIDDLSKGCFWCAERDWALKNVDK